MIRDALISPCGRYRYWLLRRWADGPVCVFLMLNPSTADAAVDDPTIRACIEFATRWGYGSILVLNLFALRATDPAELRAAADPVGPDNDTWLRLLNHTSAFPLVVAAWGRHGTLFGRQQVVRRVIERPLKALVINQDGTPKHPLYIRRDTPLRPFTAEIPAREETAPC